MNEEKNYKEEAKRIAEEMRETEEHIQRLSKERDSEKKRLEDLEVQYNEIFLRANLERLTAFRDECKRRHEKMRQQIDLLQNEKHVLRLQLKDEIEGRVFNDRAQEISQKVKKIRDDFQFYYNSSIADLVGITKYDKSIIQEFVFGSWRERIENNEKMTIEEVYRKRLEILSNPAAFKQMITHFSAGGLGACAYNKYVTVAQLARCWEYDEFTFACPECGEKAYIFQFAGHVNGGGYWELNAFCPHCNERLHYRRKDTNPVKLHWSALKRIADAISRQLQKAEAETEPSK